jgi:hypothetical protein
MRHAFHQEIARRRQVGVLLIPPLAGGRRLELSTIAARLPQRVRRGAGPAPETR